ncbi:hypothetical protein RYX36_026571 [Vicia faba]
MTEPDSETTGEKKLRPITIGIDISTWPRCVAVWNGIQVKLFSNASNKMIMKANEPFKHPGPSVGAITTSEVSLSPGQQHDMLLKATIYNMRRMIGRIDTDPVIQASKNLPFLVQTLDIGVRPLFAARMNTAWRYTTAEQVLAVYLGRLRVMAETLLQRPVRNAVFTVPVSLNRFQLARIYYACGMAGFRVLKLLPQPTAVALLYAHHQLQASSSHKDIDSGSQKTALIFNLDSGYCDVAVTAVTSEGECRMKALAGSAVGGEDLVGNMMRHLLPDSENIFKRHSDGDKEIKAMSLLRVATLEAIHRLNYQTSVEFDLDLGDGLKICKVVKKEEFEEVNKEVFETCQRLISQCLRDSKVKVERLNDVIIVGEFGNIPKVKNLVTKICIGSSKKKKGRKGKELYNAMNPLEAALCGATVAGAVASGIGNPLTLNLITSHITSLSLGIRANGNDFVCIIPRNTSIPIIKVMEFTTIHSKQTEALILVYEGEGKKVEENHLLGYLKITGIPIAGKGVPRINVCMNIDDLNWLRVVVSVFMFRSQQPVVPAMEARMPTPVSDDAHFLHYEALNRTYGDTMDLASYSAKKE